MMIPTGQESQPRETQSRLARLELRALWRRFGAITAVKDLSLSVAPGEIHALCGHNGAGKSTVVKMICGLIEPGAGEILIDGEPARLNSPQAAQRAGIAFVDQELSVISSLTVAENLMLGGIGEPLWLHRRSIKQRCYELLSIVGLPPSLAASMLGDLSIGQRQLVEIARALGRGAKVLLLDEPTATLSITEIDLVFDAVRAAAAQGCSVIFVSHRLGEVVELCDFVTVMRDGSAIATTSTVGLHPREIITQMLGHAPERATAPLPAETTPNLLIEGLQVPGVCGPVTLEICPGRIYALAGQVGSGTSDVLRALAGLHPAAVGRVTLDGDRIVLGHPALARRRGIAFVSSDRKAEGLFLNQDVRTNLLATRLKSLSSFGVVRPRKAMRMGAQVASSAGVPADRLATPIRQLSGGNQQKVLVGRNMEDSTVRVLLLDEPTRGVDVAGRHAIHELIRATADRGMAIVFSSTELDELVELAHTVVTMRNGVVISRYDGNVAEAAVLSDMTHEG
jgi:ABC-type sugar transport system ATPase subunit